MDKQFEFSQDGKQPRNIQEGKNFIKADLGNINDLGAYAMENKELGIKSEGKIFLHSLLNLTGTEVSINTFPAGYEAPFKHSHKSNEELHIILKGEGVIEVDGEEVTIKEGSVMNIKPQGVRLIKNTSNEDLVVVIIQTAQNSLCGYTLTDAII